MRYRSDRRGRIGRDRGVCGEIEYTSERGREGRRGEKGREGRTKEKKLGRVEEGRSGKWMCVSCSWGLISIQGIRGS